MFIISMDPWSLSWRKEAGLPNPLWKVRELTTNLELQLGPADPVLSLCQGCDCGQRVFRLPSLGIFICKMGMRVSFSSPHITYMLSFPVPLLQLSGTNYLSYNSIQFQHWLPGASVRFPRLKAQSQDCPHFASSGFPGYVPYHLATMSGFPTIPLLGFSNLLEQFTELQRMLYLQLQFIMKHINEQPSEEVHGIISQSPELRWFFPHGVRVHHRLSALMCSSTQKLSRLIF